MAYTTPNLGNYLYSLDPQALKRIRSFINQRRIGGTDPSQDEVRLAYEAALSTGADRAMQSRGQAFSEFTQGERLGMEGERLGMDRETQQLNKELQAFNKEMQEKRFGLDEQQLVLSKEQLQLQRELGEQSRRLQAEQMGMQDEAREEALQFQREQEEGRRKMEEERFSWERQRGETQDQYNARLQGQQGQQNMINNLMFGGLVLDKTGIGKWAWEGAKDIWKGISPSEGKYPVGGVSNIGSGFDYGGLPTGDFGAELNYDWGGYGNWGDYGGLPTGDFGAELNYDWGGYGDWGAYNWDWGSLDYGWDNAFDSWDYWNWGADFSWDLGGYYGDLIGAL